MRHIKDPKVRFWAAVALFFISILAGIHSVVFIAPGTYEKILIGISWGAITLTALDIICTADVRVNEDKKEKDQTYQLLCYNNCSYITNRKELIMAMSKAPKTTNSKNMPKATQKTSDNPFGSKAGDPTARSTKKGKKS